MRHHVAATSSAPSTPITPYLDPLKRGKKRGSYNCGRCGLPKKGHVCDGLSAPIAGDSPLTPRHPPPRPPQRVLSFDDYDVGESDDATATTVAPFESDPDWFDPDEICGGGLPAGCVWELLRRLPPPTLMSAAGVCKGWRDVAARVWKAAEEIRIRVPVKGPVEFVGSVLKKCSALVRMSLLIERNVDATMLASVAFSCPYLECMEITMAGSSTNFITGDEMSRFIVDKRYLSSFKMGGCNNLGSIMISSTSLSTLCLSDLHSLSKTIVNCPNLRDVSFNFSHQENDSTDLTIMAVNLGKCCPRLQNIHVASAKLSHATVLALTAANLRGLKMLSLVLGSGITDASVAAIADSFSKLELLDLSGSSISDSGIGIICNVFSRTLSRLLLALCPNVTSSGIQFATAQLPLLELMDCGMTICSESSHEGSDFESHKMPNNKSHHIFQKLIIKHSRLKKLSLWGCSGLDALCLNCPELNDLNLISCKNLHPERLLLQCPNLESIHAANCADALYGAIQSQVDHSLTEGNLLSKRMADGSKRVRVPHMLSQQPCDEMIKECRTPKRRCTVFLE